MTVKELNEKDFDEFIASGNAVVDFWAEWCGPCKMMSPEFDKASKNMKEVKFGKVNVDGNQELAGRFQVMSIPTVLFFKDKEQVERVSGALSASEIEERANKAYG
jgi:thioredoxin 1